MKPHQFALFWLAFFGTYLIIAFAGYVLIPEGALLDTVMKYSSDITNEGWDNFTGYVIFIGSALVNAVLIWAVMSIYNKSQGKKNQA